MKSVAIANQKGGVGKTTTAVNLSAALAALGQQTLLIDLDPQANATSGIGLEIQPGSSIYPALIGQTTAENQIQSTAYDNLLLIPSEVDLAGCEVEIARLDNPLQALKQILDPLAQNSSIQNIIIDCPPSLGILMSNALAAADGLLIPVQCEFFALEGISKIISFVQHLKEQGVNSNLEILGVVMTMFDARTRLSQQVCDEVKKHLPDKVFNTIIPRSIRISEAPSFGQPILAYDPQGVGSQSYRQLAKEFSDRVKV